MAVGFFSSLMIRTLLPLIIMLLLAASGRTLKKYNHLRAANTCAAGWFYVLFIVYPSAAAATFQAFICDTLEDGTPMLRVDYTVTCWQGQHVCMVFYAILMSLVYPFGTPLLYMALLYVNSDALEQIKRTELVAEAEATANEQRRSVAPSRLDPT